MRRRPLLRAAAIGGGAYLAGKRRLEAEHRERDAIHQLERLGKLREQGLLTDEEFAAQKARLLGGASPRGVTPQADAGGQGARLRAS